MNAAHDGHADCVRALLEGGAEKSVKNKVRACDSDCAASLCSKLFE